MLQDDYSRDIYLSFYTCQIKCSFFLENLCVDIESSDAHANFKKTFLTY
jgi:hypothetical protein